MQDFMEYRTPARVMACQIPTFNQEEMGIAHNGAEVDAIIAAMPEGYRFATLRMVGCKNVNRSFRTDEEYRHWVNPVTCSIAFKYLEATA